MDNNSYFQNINNLYQNNDLYQNIFYGNNQNNLLQNDLYGINNNNNLLQNIYGISNDNNSLQINNDNLLQNNLSGPNNINNNNFIQNNLSDPNNINNNNFIQNNLSDLNNINNNNFIQNNLSQIPNNAYQNVFQDNISQNNQNILQNSQYLNNTNILNENIANNLNFLSQNFDLNDPNTINNLIATLNNNQNTFFQNNNILPQIQAYNLNQQNPNYNINILDNNPNNISLNNNDNLYQYNQDIISSSNEQNMINQIIESNPQNPSLLNVPKDNISTENTSKEVSQEVERKEEHERKEEPERKEELKENSFQNKELKEITGFHISYNKRKTRHKDSTQQNLLYIQIQKFDSYILIKSDKYETTFDEKELSEIIQRNLGSIEEAYKFIIDSFKKKRIEIKKKIKKKEIILNLKVKVGDSKQKSTLVITLDYIYKESLSKRFKKGGNLKLLIKELRNETESIKKEYANLRKLREKLNLLIKRKQNDRNKAHLNTKEFKVIQNLITDSYAEDELDNTFALFKSMGNILTLIYSNENFSIISYNLEDHMKMIEIKNAHKNYVTNFRHYLDKINNRDLIISISSIDNNLKVWNFQNWECIVNLEKVNKEGTLDSACIFTENKENYIITSNNNDKEDEELEKIKIYDFNGVKIKEIGYSNDRTFFIDTFYEKRLGINFILTGNEGCVKSYDFSHNKLYHNYSVEHDEESHTNLVVKRLGNSIKIVEAASESKSIRIWDFHKGELITKISFKDSGYLQGICFWDNYNLIVGCGKKIIIIDINKGTVIRTVKNFCENDILTIKKIYHPVYEKSLIIQGLQKSNIKLLFFVQKPDNINNQ